MRRLRALVVATLFAGMASPMLAWDCFDYCHGNAMVVYEVYGERPAAMYFDGCMSTCGGDFSSAKIA